MLCHRGVKLSVGVAPLSHAPYVDKVLSKQLLILPVTELVLRPSWTSWRFTAACFAQPLPKFQITCELTFLIVKFDMRLIGLRLRLQRPVSHVLHRQSAGNDQHFV